MNEILSFDKCFNVFFDIDDTIIIPKSLSFRCPPYNGMIDRIKEKKELIKNYEQIISNWRVSRKVMLLDENWPCVIENLKKKMNIFALTKMNTGKFGCIDSMEKWRYNELKSLGIIFSNKNINLPKSFDLKNNSPSFCNGIFMTGNLKKSEVLNEIIKTTDLSKGITFVDDRECHIFDVEKFCNKNYIPFLGILFNGLKNFNEYASKEIAEFQEKYLLENAIWLEDEEVLSYL